VAAATTLSVLPQAESEMVANAADMFFNMRSIGAGQRKRQAE
jgi:hypothetical protein